MDFTISERTTKAGKVVRTIYVKNLAKLSPADEKILALYIGQGYKVAEKKETKRKSKPEDSLTKESLLAMLKADKLETLYAEYEKKIADKENFMKIKKAFLADMKKAILDELTAKHADKLAYYVDKFEKKGASVLAIREEFKKEFYAGK